MHVTLQETKHEYLGTEFYLSTVTEYSFFLKLFTFTLFFKQIPVIFTPFGSSFTVECS